jgi:LysM repeat protein
LTGSQVVAGARRGHGYDRDAMPRRATARILAPLALVAGLIAVLVVIGGSSGDSTSRTRSHSSRRSASGGPAGRRVARRNASKPPATRRTYVVQQGDTLSTIAAKTHVSLATLQELNPNVDPQGLHAGQRLRIK